MNYFKEGTQLAALMHAGPDMYSGGYKQDSESGYVSRESELIQVYAEASFQANFCSCEHTAIQVQKKISAPL